MISDRSNFKLRKKFVVELIETLSGEQCYVMAVNGVVKHTERYMNVPLVLHKNMHRWASEVGATVEDMEFVEVDWGMLLEHVCGETMYDCNEFFGYDYNDDVGHDYAVFEDKLKTLPSPLPFGKGKGHDMVFKKFNSLEEIEQWFR